MNAKLTHNFCTQIRKLHLQSFVSLLVVLHTNTVGHQVSSTKFLPLEGDVHARRLTSLTLNRNELISAEQSDQMFSKESRRPKTKASTPSVAAAAAASVLVRNPEAQNPKPSETFLGPALRFSDTPLPRTRLIAEQNLPPLTRVEFLRLEKNYAHLISLQVRYAGYGMCT